MANSTSLALVSLKSFGDFIIARWALRQVDTTASAVTLLMGEHLAELDAVLGSAPSARSIRHGEDGVPALFDVKKTGLRRGLVSALRLRNLLRSLRMPLGTTLVFDRIGARERFIAASAPIRALPSSENVYLAYGALFGIPANTFVSSPLRLPPATPSIGIFPDSRIAAKTLPAHVVSSLVDICREHGRKVDVFRLEGEGHDLRADATPVTLVPRRFSAMAQAVRSVDVVISADSMPAHMAEYFDRPVFVLSPVANPYWLPLSCFVSKRWSLFDDTSTPPEALHSLVTPSTAPRPVSS